METTRLGGCLCGQIRYRLSAEPLTLYACHCTDCQRLTGASFALSMVVLKASVTLLRGEPQRYALTLPDGREKHSTFCGRCSTRLWGEPAKLRDVVILRPGTLDDTSWVWPIAHIWTRSAQPWIVIPPDAINIPGQPDDPMLLVNAWREQHGATRR